MSLNIHEEASPVLYDKQFTKIIIHLYQLLQDKKPISTLVLG